VETKRQRAIISCVGEGLQKIGAAGKMRQMLSEVQPALSWHSASNLSLVSMVDADLAGPALRQLHQALFPSEPLA